MTLMTKNTMLLPLALAAMLFANLAAAEHRGNPNPLPCPVIPYDGVTPMDTEFLGDVQSNTQCLRKRQNAKVVISVGHTFPFTATGVAQKTKATFFSNLDHLVKNYENVHGMTIGKDVEIVVVLLESGALLAANDHAVFSATGTTVVPNPFISLVQQAMDKGIKIYLCQTAARNLGLNATNIIPGIHYVPGGHIAVADFQLQGYALIQP